MKAEIKKLPKSEMEIEFELTAEEFKEHTLHALEHLRRHVKADGFRPGRAPLKMVQEKVGKENLLMEAGDHAVKHVYSEYVSENNLEPISQPQVSIIKIAEGSPFLFKVKFAVMPEIKLPDYKEIASKIIRQLADQDVSVTDKEVEDTINYLQKSRAKFSQLDAPAEKGNFVEIEYENENVNSGKPVQDKFVLGQAGFTEGFEQNLIGMKAGQEKEFEVKFPPARHNAEALGGEKSSLAGKQQKFKVKMISVQKMELSELNDEFAKQLGNFESMAALKENIKEGITAEKKESEKQRKRNEILERISEKSSFEVPDSMIEAEKEHLFLDLKNNITNNFKMPFEEYLRTVKKTEQELKETFKKEAEKRLRTFLVLREIGKKENVEVSGQETEEEMNNSVKNYSKQQLEKIDIDQLKEYAKGVIINEKIFQILENFSK